MIAIVVNIYSFYKYVLAVNIDLNDFDFINFKARMEQVQWNKLKERSNEDFLKETIKHCVGHDIILFSKNLTIWKESILALLMIQSLTKQLEIKSCEVKDNRTMVLYGTYTENKYYDLN